MRWLTSQDFVPISFRKNTINRVDAAIAEVQSGKVDSSGSILNIGEVSTVTTVPVPGMSVKKNGRTTGLTLGTDNGCRCYRRYSIPETMWSKQIPRIARFSGQIIIGPVGFSAGGDSGSLIVEDCSPHPRAVGLLFGGSSSHTLANPISDVLSQLGVSIVGTSGFCTPSASGPAVATQALPQVERAELENSKEVKERHKEATLGIPGVVGMGIGFSETVPGKAVIEVYVKEPAQRMRGMIPETLENVPVRIVETGEFIAY